MKRLLSCFVAIATVCALCFTSCKDDDPKDPDPNAGGLVSDKVPAEGWSGNADNGILKYSLGEADEDEPNTYYAFNMKDGVCESAVVNVVMPDANIAKQFAKILNDGSWVNYGDDEDDEDDYYAPRHSFDMTLAVMKRALSIRATRANLALPIPVKQSGKVIYVSLPNMKGLSDSDLRTVMEVWNGYASEIPDHVIFGKYENGTYTCSNMHGMNIDYVVNTQFNTAGHCTKYVTRITLPTEGWAQFYYEVYEEQISDFEMQFGQRPDLSISGKTVVLDAAIVGEVSRADVDAMICTLDWLNNRPFVSDLF